MHGTKGDSQKSSSSWLDLCNNGNCSIPPTGLEFHNTQLLHNSTTLQPPNVNVAAVSHQVPPSPREQVVDKQRQKEMIKCSNNPIGSLPQNNSLAIGAQASKGHKRPTYSGNISNSSAHYYTGPHYSQLAAAASSNYNRYSRYSYYQQHHHHT